MNVALYEKIWMWAAGALIAAFLGTVLVSSIGGALEPPSHVETIDPTNVWSDPRFATPGVTESATGTTVVVIAMTFTFAPNEIHVPAHRRVTFRITSTDVTHGFEIVGTNGNTMVIPGYVSQFSVTFDRPGEYLILCNEYCGLGHHLMSAKLIVEEARR
jgi:cytochrome c oxidase subunit II